MGSCQNWKNIKILSAYNSKTLVHKLMKFCILIDSNKVYLMIESSLQLTLYKSVIKKLKNLKISKTYSKVLPRVFPPDLFYFNSGTLHSI